MSTHGDAAGEPARELERALARYRVAATVVGVLLVVLILVGVPLKYAHVPVPGLWPEGSRLQLVGEGITSYLGTAHGWLYMIFLVLAILLSRRARWDLGFTLVTLACGTVPLLSFWAERRATRRVREQLAAPTGSSFAGRG